MACVAGENRDSDIKVFCFFSSEKKAFSLSRWLPAFTQLYSFTAGDENSTTAKYRAPHLRAVP